MTLYELMTRTVKPIAGAIQYLQLSNSDERKPLKPARKPDAFYGDTKACTSCGEVKLLAHFYELKKIKTGYHYTRCKPCMKNYRKAINRREAEKMSSRAERMALHG